MGFRLFFEDRKAACVSAQSKSSSCLDAEFPTEPHRMPGVCLGDRVPRIPRLNRIAGEQAKGRMKGGPKRFDATTKLSRWSKA